MKKIYFGNCGGIHFWELYSLKLVVEFAFCEKQTYDFFQAVDFVSNS